MDPSDVNVAVHSALKNALIARQTGLVTMWRARTNVAISGTTTFVFQLDTASLTFDSALIGVDANRPTVFRRDSHTHPLAVTDRLTTESGHGALAWLNDDSAGPRYRASSISSEHHLVKQLVLQSSNSLAGPSRTTVAEPFGAFTRRLDNRPPQVLADQQVGVPEPEGNAVTFAAPVSDLFLPDELRFPTEADRNAQLPCFFLEDLWIGYRLDLLRHPHAEFTSIHAQTQVVDFATGGSISGQSEDYIEREQPDDQARGFSAQSCSHIPV